MAKALFDVMPSGVRRLLFPAPVPSYDKDMQGLEWTEPDMKDREECEAGDIQQEYRFVSMSSHGCNLWPVSRSLRRRSHGPISIPFHTFFPLHSKTLVPLDKHTCLPLIIVFSHENGSDMGQSDYLQHYANMWKCPIVSYEYPGYGVLANEHASTENINAAIESILTHVKNHMGYRNKDIVLMGRSIGTGPTCSAAAGASDDDAFAGVVLISPYTSITDVVTSLANNRIGKLSHILQSMAKNVVPRFWDNLYNIGRFPKQTGALIIHGQKDELIPVSHGEMLFNHCRATHRQLITPPNATHNEFTDSTDIIKPVAQFLKRCLE